MTIKTAKEVCWCLLGNADFRQGLGPHTHQGGAQCMGRYFHEWHREGQENPQHVGKGPNLIFWQGARQWVSGRYPLEHMYLWYERHCTWLQDLLYCRRAEVDVEDAIVGARTDPGTSENQEGLFPCGVHKAIVTRHSNKKPYRSRCGLCQVRLFCDGPLCSRSQYLRVLADMP